ncbi:TetR/AcrR family transcriptional regulator [Streptomyces sp. NBC_01618]|uniref:TetR/AcrR family transcriptional regulator n=1 Tax=Streptomyces sp. NBC_01618 TaxID=2975900 RepID=UPI00386FB07F|nr:TetR/AcrR family transcriptional regulator [Streptomyces sp. NBC_01618]
MRPRSSYKAPPSQTLIYSAVVQSMAEHGPRKMNMALAARIAETDRQLLYRNWPDRQVLVREAAESELQRVLFVASDLLSEQEGVCQVAEMIVRAARMVREHPVTRTTARTDPDLLRNALLDMDTRLHGRARYWLEGLFPEPLARTLPPMYWLRDVLLTIAAPFALTPPEEPHTDSGPADSSHADYSRPDTSRPDTSRTNTSRTNTSRAALDRRLRVTLHVCLGAAPDCPCTSASP